MIIGLRSAGDGNCLATAKFGPNSKNLLDREFQ